MARQRQSQGQKSRPPGRRAWWTSLTDLRQALEQIRNRRRAHPYPASPAVRLVAGLGLLVAGGTLLMALPISSVDGGLRLDQAVFTALSALSTTGLNVITPGRDLSVFGQVVLVLLMQIGGIGFTVGAVAVFRLLGRRITLEERLALRDSLGMLSSEALLRLTGLVLRGYLLIEGAGALLLWLNWRRLLSPGQAAFYAVFHSVSAFSNASFDLFSGSPEAPVGFPIDVATLLTISTLIILGSIGIPVLANLANWPQRRSLSLHSRITLVTTGCLLVGGTLALFASELARGHVAAGEWPRWLLLSYFHSAASRTAGFVLEPLSSMAPASILILTMLMYVGGSPASMGGGITTSTLAVLVLAMWNYVRGRSEIVVGKRTIPTETVLKAVAILTVSLLVVASVTWLLLLTHPISFSDALFETISAFTTCGFTLGLTPQLNTFGRVLIGLTMFWGRLGALTIVVALARRQPPQTVTFPEESILIG